MGRGRAGRCRRGFMPFRSRTAGHLPLMRRSGVADAVRGRAVHRSAHPAARAGCRRQRVVRRAGSWYLAYALAFMLPLSVVRAPHAGRVAGAAMVAWPAAAGAVAALVSSPFLYEMLRLHGQGQWAVAGRWTSGRCNPYDIFLPNPLAPVVWRRR